MHTVLGHKHPQYFCALAQIIVDHNDMFSSEKTTIDTHSQGGGLWPTAPYKEKNSTSVPECKAQKFRQIAGYF
jgi:hypothetical protein